MPKALTGATYTPTLGIHVAGRRNGHAVTAFDRGFLSGGLVMLAAVTLARIAWRLF